MATPPSNEVVLGRIDQLEAMLNGLFIYLAAKEEGVTLDLSDQKARDFIKDNVLREKQYRLKTTGQVVDDGHGEAMALSIIRDLREALAALK